MDIDMISDLNTAKYIVYTEITQNEEGNMTKRLIDQLRRFKCMRKISFGNSHKSSTGSILDLTLRQNNSQKYFSVYLCIFLVSIFYFFTSFPHDSMT